MKKIELYSSILEEKLENTPETKRFIFDELIKEFEKYSLVFIGLRQVGKTILAEQIINNFDMKNQTNEDDDLVRSVSKNKLYINLKSYYNFGEEDADDIFKYVNEMKPKYCFIDEVQVIKNWSSFAQVIIDANPNTKFILTGSNAYSLSDEIIFNRAKIYSIKPLSWNEYKSIWDNNDFEEYCKFGSYPPSNNNKTAKLNYINMVEEQIIDKIVIEDAIGLIKITKFKEFVTRIKNHIGNEIIFSNSFNDIVSRPTVKNYIKLLINSKLVNRVWKYNDKSSKPKSKLYFQDKSMIYWMNNYENLNNNDLGSFIENLVFNQLDFLFNKQYKSEKVFYYKDKKEIDFILPDFKILIEVKFVKDLDVEKESQKYNDISKDFKDYKKIIITQNFEGKKNGWFFIKLQTFLEMSKNDILWTNK